MDATLSTTAADGQNQFLQLLVAQLQNQDPLSPLQQEDFLGQLAQFSTLEGVEKLNASFDSYFRLNELTQGSQLLGKEVRYQAGADVLQGAVTAVQADGGQVTLTVDGTAVPLSEILELRAE